MWQRMTCLLQIAAPRIELLSCEPRAQAYSYWYKNPFAFYTLWQQNSLYSTHTIYSCSSKSSYLHQIFSVCSWSVWDQDIPCYHSDTTREAHSQCDQRGRSNTLWRSNITKEIRSRPTPLVNSSTILDWESKQAGARYANNGWIRFYQKSDPRTSQEWGQGSLNMPRSACK